MTFQAHERHTEKLIRHLSVEAPAGYHSTTLAQVLRADREVFTWLSQNVEDIRPTANKKPLDDKLVEALQDYNTTFHLLPLPKAFAKEEAYVARKSPTSESPAPYRSKGKGKGRSKGKPGGGLNVAPQGMVGCVACGQRCEESAYLFQLQYLVM